MASKIISENSPIYMVGTFFYFISSTISMAADCNFRGNIGHQETAQHIFNEMDMGIENAYSNHNISSNFAQADGGCILTEQLSVTARASGEFSQFYGTPAQLEGKSNSFRATYNEVYLTWKPSNSLFIDIGKIDKKRGYLLSISPMDQMRNPLAYPLASRINNKGSTWTNYYREGSYGINTTLYNKWGTLEFTALPRLSHRGDEAKEDGETYKSYSQWKTVERTNSNDRYALSFTSTGFNDFNPAVTLHFGDIRGISMGTSTNLSDSLILSVEGAYIRSKIRALDYNLVDQFWDYTFPSQLFSYQENRSANFGLSLRYMVNYNDTIGLEYYAQSGGYSRGDWNKFFSYAEARTALKPYISSLFQGIFENYSKLFALELDNISRRGLPMGKHYVTVYASHNNDELQTVNMNASAFVNVIDYSSLLNLHTSMFFTENLEGYIGAYFSLGKEDSEFGQFSEKGSFYVGLQYIW